MLVRRSVQITWFVILWMLIFHYETLRANYLTPLAGRPLPKLALLFPPAGWIMFFQVDRAYGFAEVQGVRANGEPVRLDPHAIFETPAVGYDNIHRNVLVAVLSKGYAPSFCRFLKRKFPEYERFTVLYGVYPDVVAAPDQTRYAVAYRCEPEPRGP